jgi:hypothetical protein
MEISRELDVFGGIYLVGIEGKGEFWCHSEAGVILK